MNEKTNWLSNLKAGDEVVLCVLYTRRYSAQSASLQTVQRVTLKSLWVDTISFNRGNGTVNRLGTHHTERAKFWLEEVTSEWQSKFRAEEEAVALWHWMYGVQKDRDIDRRNAVFSKVYRLLTQSDIIQTNRGLI